MGEECHIYGQPAFDDDRMQFNRTKKFAERIRVWNNDPQNRTVKYAIAIGGVQWTHAPEHIEWKAGEIWNQLGGK